MHIVVYKVLEKMMVRKKIMGLLEKSWMKLNA